METIYGPYWVEGPVCIGGPGEQRITKNNPDTISFCHEPALCFHHIMLFHYNNISMVTVYLCPHHCRRDQASDNKCIISKDNFHHSFVILLWGILMSPLMMWHILVVSVMKRHRCTLNRKDSIILFWNQSFSTKQVEYI